MQFAIVKSISERCTKKHLENSFYKNKKNSFVQADGCCECETKKGKYTCVAQNYSRLM